LCISANIYYPFCQNQISSHREEKGAFWRSFNRRRTPSVAGEIETGVLARTPKTDDNQPQTLPTFEHCISANIYPFCQNKISSHREEQGLSGDCSIAVVRRL
jgi:hypothetical protein